ncbi:uncharacterized protein M6B38_294605 [Iris pallida]|uniref:Uncharacterized protein n=1 Tax=Iris pallida TaxID=29817 RepID=A0AAX6HSC4_IRIPA|nr:uncharacterized protein M6B38_294605 [Iris pallida]
MDTRARASMIQNENLPIHKGKEGAAKADVPRASKAGRQERKALRDLSLKPEKPPLSSIAAAAATTTKSAARSRDAAANTEIPTEESDRCRTWAEEGVERMPYYDAQKHQREQIERRVEKKVQRAVADMRGWTGMMLFYGLEVPTEEFDVEDVLKLEVEPEVLLSRPPSRRTNLLLNPG